MLQTCRNAQTRAPSPAMPSHGHPITMQKDRHECRPKISKLNLTNAHSGLLKENPVCILQPARKSKIWVGYPYPFSLISQHLHLLGAVALFCSRGTFRLLRHRRHAGQHRRQYGRCQSQESATCTQIPRRCGRNSRPPKASTSINKPLAWPKRSKANGFQLTRSAIQTKPTGHQPFGVSHMYFLVGQGRAIPDHPDHHFAQNVATSVADRCCCC